MATLVICTLDRGIAQSFGGHTLFGDFKVDESGTVDIKPISYDIILYSQGGRVVARQAVTNNGRYRFIDLPDGEYNIVVELENSEVARIRVTLASPVRSDFRQDILMEWRPNSAGAKRKGKGVVSVAEGYERAPANRTLFDRAGEAAQKKDYEQTVSLLRQILNADPKDFEAWTELGTALLTHKHDDDAEKAYLSALERRPTYILALVNLGKLRVMRKNYEGAIETLSQAVKVQPQSPTVNYYLGEAYLQIKKGSKAVIYLNEALKLDPIGKAEAHLRLAALYNAAGMKDRAAVEYEQFLNKKPDYPNKSKIQQYISENKKP
jgi:Flp pilus assembly protein TadD